MRMYDCERFLALNIKMDGYEVCTVSFLPIHFKLLDDSLGKFYEFDFS